MKSKFALALLASVAVIAAAATDALAAGRGGGADAAGAAADSMVAVVAASTWVAAGCAWVVAASIRAAVSTRPRLMAAASGWAVARQASMASTRAVPTDSPDATLALAAFPDRQ